MLKISTDRINELMDAIASKMDLILPVENNGQVNFGIYESGVRVRLDALKTVKSAKDAFFPQSETLYSCSKDLKNLSVTPAKLMDRPFAVFGMKGCDIRGLEVLDRVFLSDPVDSFYKARRENGIVIGMVCNTPWESCFCKAFGVDCTEPGGDATACVVGDGLFIEANNEKGKAFLEMISEVLISETLADNCIMRDTVETISKDGTEKTALEDDKEQSVSKDGTEKTADADDMEKLRAHKESIRRITEKLPLMSLSLKGWGTETPKDRFDSPLWEKLYKPCLACGTCTFVCPTCQCYDIKDHDDGDSVRRYRCWDSCMYSDFTLMAHGNPRTSQMQRFRQRFMHKLVYYPQNNDGIFSCTGCGRCIDKCPQSLNIVKVIKAFEKEGKENV